MERSIERTLTGEFLETFSSELDKIGSSKFPTITSDLRASRIERETTYRGYPFKGGLNVLLKGSLTLPGERVVGVLSKQVLPLRLRVGWKTPHVPEGDPSSVRECVLGRG